MEQYYHPEELSVALLKIARRKKKKEKETKTPAQTMRLLWFH